MTTNVTNHLPKNQPSVFGNQSFSRVNQLKQFNQTDSLMLSPCGKKLQEELNHNIIEITSLETTKTVKPPIKFLTNSLDTNLNDESIPFLSGSANILPTEEICRTSEDSVIRTEQSELATLENLALDLEQNGKYMEAIEVYLKLMKEEELNLVLGVESSVKLRNNMAIVYCRLGKYSEAVEIFSQILNILYTHTELNQIKTDFSENSNGAISIEQAIKNNLALALSSTGDYSQSSELFAEVLKKREATLQTNHPDILATKHNIALVLKNQGQNKEALQLCSEILSTREETLGPDHLDTLSTRSNMASVLTSLGNFEAALDSFTEILEKQENILGKEHPQTLKTYHNLAVVMNLQQNHIEALRIYKEIIKTRKEILGTDHPDTLSTMHNAALVLHAQGNYRRPMRIHQKISQNLEDVFSQNHQHPFNLSNDLNMASVLVSQRAYENALSGFERVLEKLESTDYGVNHPDTLVAKFNKASVLVSLKRFKEAEQVYTEILEFDKNDKDGEFCGEGFLKRKSVAQKRDLCKKIAESKAKAPIWSKLFHFICG